MKRLELTIPISLLDDLGILSARFFRNNRSVRVLQSFSIRPLTNVLIVRVLRKGPFKDATSVRREARTIARRYHVTRVELLSMDQARGEYVAWIQWRVPARLSRLLGDEGSGVVPLEVTELNRTEARATLLAAEDVVPVLRRLLDDVEAPYRVRAMRTPAPEAWEPLASLTKRQRDLLELAFRLGYYESPARATLRQIAALDGISRAAVSKHLRAGERKVLANAIGAPR